MTRRAKILVLGVLLMVAVKLFLLPGLFERIYRVPDSQSQGDRFVSVGSGQSQKDKEYPHISFTGPAEKEVVARWIANSGKVLVLRWSDGRLWWGDKAILADEVPPYVSGLLQSENTDTVLVVIPEETKWREVVGVFDRMRQVKAHLIEVCWEI